jgi:hypothetical protein
MRAPRFGVFPEDIEKCEWIDFYASEKRALQCLSLEYADDDISFNRLEN